jgi:cytochrome c oxidase assembly protein subunit 15
MFGRVVPQGLLTVHEPWWVNLVEPIGSHWVHRWFAFLPVALAAALLVAVRRDHAGSRPLSIACGLLLAALGVQIAVGIGVVVWGVPKWLALAHQGIGVVLFSVVLVITHRVQRRFGARVSRPTRVVD